MDFNTAFEKLMQFEGGFVNNPKDPGGATNFGITQAVARSHGYTGDMQALPVGTAKAIYQTDYWNLMLCDNLPDPLKYPVFDAAVNNGSGNARRWLLLAEQGDCTPQQQVARFCGYRLKYYASLPTWPVFGHGWVNRVSSILIM